MPGKGVLGYKKAAGCLAGGVRAGRCWGWGGVKMGKNNGVWKGKGNTCKDIGHLFLHPSIHPPPMLGVNGWGWDVGQVWPCSPHCLPLPGHGQLAGKGKTSKCPPSRHHRLTVPLMGTPKSTKLGIMGCLAGKVVGMVGRKVLGGQKKWHT